MRSILLAVVAFATLTSPAFGQSFAQLAGDSGCVMQTGAVTEDEFEEDEAPPITCSRAGGLMDARSVVVSPDQRHVYVVASGGAVTGSNGVAVFARDAASGVLSARACVTATGGDGRVGSDGLCGRADALRDARALAFSPDGRFVYVVAAGSNAVSWFSRDVETGVLTQVGCIKHTFGFGERCASGYALDGAAGVAVSPDGKHVYVAGERSGAVVTFARDAGTGALTELGCVSDTGSDGQCADGVALAGAQSVLMASDGEDVYVTSALSGSVVGLRRDATTGALTPRACLLADAPVGGPCTSVPSLVGARGGTLSPDGRNLYVAGYEENTLTTLTRDPATGALAAAGCLQYGSPTREEVVDPEEFYDEDEDTERLPGCVRAAALSQPTAVTVAADGRTVFAVGGYSLTAFTRDVATGALTQFGCAETYLTLKACSASRAVEGGGALAASGDGRNLYVTSATWSSVAVFSASVAIASSRARVSRGAIRVRLSCPRVAARGCSGSVRVAGARAARFRVASGASRAVTLRVSRAASRRRAAIVVAQVGGRSDVRRRVALR
ncbi:lactonase family protein [Solirubrobacter phytolaccae]|uniref:Lactonase family protein n=1 Tax=Solirubrobacter phytolaccae TaxID=1404360 RepID=A0A9X3SF29_9ACTN|nr:beta-propeller fold lactonase family protein [Solirubrobacter phytolaccae]MDA0185615.1 lactonase family protein [Solirubrobacter phytolaccae]